jgi:predicted enzyme related to lactoylglutathione lyase
MSKKVIKRVTGLGGFFFKSENPDQIKQWYATHLGIPVDTYGWTFWWKDENGKKCSTQWSPFEAKTSYFKPSEKPFMMNFRVDDLVALLEVLQEEGVTIVGEMEEFEYGKFAWVLDPEGNKVELWEPIDEAFL